MSSTGVTDLARARDFYVNLLGLIETARERDRIYLRCIEDREHHRLVLRQAERSASHETQRRGAEDRLATGRIVVPAHFGRGPVGRVRHAKAGFDFGFLQGG